MTRFLRTVAVCLAIVVCMAAGLAAFYVGNIARINEVGFAQTALEAFAFFGFFGAVLIGAAIVSRLRRPRA